MKIKFLLKIKAIGHKGDVNDIFRRVNIEIH